MAIPATKSSAEISETEWQVRFDLAACYRLFVKYGLASVGRTVAEAFYYSCVLENA